MSEQAYWFYVLYSLKDHKLYEGSCADVGKRFLMHSVGGVISTKHRRPLVLIYLKKFDDKADAQLYERFSKTLSGGKALIEELNVLGILPFNSSSHSDG